jgi:hypothetical protein
VASFNLNGQTFTTGASNGAATDLLAVNALIDQVEAIIANWGVAYRAGGGAFFSQGSSVAGSTAGRDAVSAALARCANAAFQLDQLGAVKRVATG